MKEKPQELVESPSEYCASTIALKKTIESGFIVLGERLARIKAEKMWESQWSSFAEYLHEMNINEGTASKLIAVHQTYVQKYGLDENLLIEAGWSNLYEVRNIAGESKNKQEVEDLVRKVTTLKRDDTREMVREHKNPHCDHNWIEIHLRQCTECAKREKIYDDE